MNMNTAVGGMSKMRKKAALLLSYIISMKCIGRLLPDKLFLKINYRLCVGKKLNLNNPKSFNEKLQWLKLHNRNPDYTVMVDKYKVRKYIADSIGEKYLIPLIGVWDSADDIDFDQLPDRFVLKCNHNSGAGRCICTDKKALNISEVRKSLSKALKHNYYLENREFAYKNVERKIIAEKYMVDESGTELKDYKFFCFDGEPKFMYVASGRHSELCFDFYDMDFKPLPFENAYPNSATEHTKPLGFDEMVECARKLSEGIKHVRIDFYDINGKVYFGEITFFHMSGFSRFEPDEWDYKIGNMLMLD